MNVLIFGAQGALGKDLVEVFTDIGHEVTALDREQIDITDEDSVRSAITEAEEFDVVINAAAWNDVDGAEDAANYDDVLAINGVAPGVMAEAAKAINAKFVHYSSDYVFEGKNQKGYTEDDKPKPISKYGESKLAGEKAVEQLGEEWFVCRLSKLFGRPGTSDSAKPSFVSIMMKLAAEKPELSIIDEEVGSPTYSRDVAEATIRLVTEEFEPGTYHFINEGAGVTWHGFAEEFFTMNGITTPRKAVSAAEFGEKPAKRPAFAQLLNTKFPSLRSRDEALRAHFVEARMKETQ